MNNMVEEVRKDVKSLCQKSIWESLAGYGWKDAKTVHIRCKIGLMKTVACLCVCVYVPANMNIKKGNNKREVSE